MTPSKSGLDPKDLVGAELAGKYRVEARLGAGGFGAVYRGTHVDTGGPVAIKALLRSPRGDDEEFSRRFRQEAATLSHLNHPHIVDVKDYGQSDGLEFLVLELIEGRNLAEELRAGPMPWRRALRIIRQIALALAAAHDRGVVHRDLKPANVMLVDHLGVPDHVKVLDFGIAKIVDASSAMKPMGASTTREGIAVGTPRYMSPEQCRGEELDGRADLYSIGCLTFLILTGRSPFNAGSEAEMLGMHLFSAPPPLPRVGADGAPPHPDDLVTLVARLLDKDRQARPRDAMEFVTLVDAILDGRPAFTASGPVPAGPPPPPLPPAATTVRTALQFDSPTPLAAGEIQPSGVHGARPRWPAAALAIALLIGVALAGLGLRSEGPTQRPAASPTAEPRAVEIEFTSTPPGARIQLDDRSLGRTPLTAEVDRPIAELTASRRYVIELDGHRLEDLSLRAVADGGRRRVVGRAVLTPVPAPPAPIRAPSPPPAVTPPRARQADPPAVRRRRPPPRRQPSSDPLGIDPNL